MIIKEKNKLRAISEEVSVEEGLEIGSKLILELENHSNGIGLAAPQIGINKRVFVIKREKTNIPTIFINPKIIKKEYPYLFKGEGCLSFPEVLMNTIRYKNITAIDDLTKSSYLLKGIDAVCFEHEFDHLNGTLMFDKVEPLKYDLCFCDSGKKYKFCHYKEVNGKK